jgi:hypothetical protein
MGKPATSILAVTVSNAWAMAQCPASRVRAPCRRKSGWASNGAGKWACNSAPFLAGRPGMAFGKTCPVSRRWLREPLMGATETAKRFATSARLCPASLALIRAATLTLWWVIDQTTEHPRSPWAEPPWARVRFLTHWERGPRRAVADQASRMSTFPSARPGRSARSHRSGHQARTSARLPGWRLARSLPWRQRC